MLPATYVLTKVNGFFGTKKKISIPIKKTKIKNNLEFSFDEKSEKNVLNENKSDLEKEMENEMAIEIGIGLGIDNEIGKGKDVEKENIVNEFQNVELNNNYNNSVNYINYNTNKNIDTNINEIEYINRNENENENDNIITKMKKSVIRFGRKESPGFWKKKKIGTSDWLTFSPQENWVWWVIGGYTVSVLLFRLSDWINGVIIPCDWFELGNGHIVSQMVAPEGNDVIALILGAIAPCLSAPLWEEVFYR